MSANPLEEYDTIVAEALAARAAKEVAAGLADTEEEAAQLAIEQAKTLEALEILRQIYMF